MPSYCNTPPMFPDKFQFTVVALFPEYQRVNAAQIAHKLRLWYLSFHDFISFPSQPLALAYSLSLSVTWLGLSVGLAQPSGTYA